jgi:prepilin-type N-terminal cleavage/methylation domain-containing protein
MATKTMNQYSNDRLIQSRQKGFGLVELLVALAISGFLGVGIWTVMQSQHNTYDLQDTSAEMQQNLRSAVDRISRDIMAAGLGPQWQMTAPDGNTTTWYVPVGGDLWPYSASANTINLIGSTGEAMTMLASTASSGATTLTLQAGGGAAFSAGSFVSVGGKECARVTNVAGNVLTIDTNPAGTAHTLQSSYPAGTLIFPIRWVTYTLADNTLTANLHDGNGAVPIASRISALGLTWPEGDRTLLTLTLTGSARNGVASTIVNKVRMRNQPVAG